VVDPLQAFRAAASIGTRDRHFTLLRHDPGMLAPAHDVGSGQDGYYFSVQWDQLIGCGV
jgi:hypothetical protein